MKDIGQFARDRTSRDGLQGYCTECSSAYSASRYQSRREEIKDRKRNYQRDRRAADPEYNTRTMLWTKFRLTIEAYKAKLDEQNGLCAVCLSPPSTRRLAVDHDRTCCGGDRSCGRCVRGLLCSGCNNGTGIADSPALLRRKADYIERWKNQTAGDVAPPQ